MTEETERRHHRYRRVLCPTCGMHVNLHPDGTMWIHGRGRKEGKGIEYCSMSDQNPYKEDCDICGSKRLAHEDPDGIMRCPTCRRRAVEELGLDLADPLLEEELPPAGDDYGDL